MNILESLLNLYPNENWNWKNLSENSSFGIKSILKYENKICLNSVSKNPNLTKEFIDTHILNTNYLSSNPCIFTLNIQNKIRINYDSVSINPAITDDFIKDNLNDLNLFYLGKNPNLKMNMINYISEKLDIEKKTQFYCNILENPNITPNFALELINNGLPIYDYLQNKNINTDIIKKIWYKLSIDDLALIANNSNIDMELTNMLIGINDTINMNLIASSKFINELNLIIDSDIQYSNKYYNITNITNINTIKKNDITNYYLSIHPNIYKFIPNIYQYIDWNWLSTNTFCI